MRDAVTRMMARFHSHRSQRRQGAEVVSDARRYAASGPSARQQLLEAVLEGLAPAAPGAGDLLANALGDGRLVAALRSRSGANESLVYAHHVFSEVDFLSRKHGARPNAVLEIGTGTNLGVLFCFVASGVGHAAGIDIAPMSDPGPAFYRSLCDYLACVEGFTWWRQFASEPSHPGVSFPTCKEALPPEQILGRIDYRAPVPADRLPFVDRSFDLVFSVAALEHVPEPAGTVAELARVTRPGGLSVHEIDVKHHGSPDALRFLSWSWEEYQARAQGYGDGRGLAGILDGSWQGEVFCNRLRMSDWRDLFERAGFDILEVEPVTTLDPSLVDPQRFVEPFRSKLLDDLAVLAFRIVACLTRR